MTARRFDMTERPRPAANTADRAASTADGHERPTGMADVLSDVLRAVRLRGAVYYAVTASTPWVAEAPPARELARHVMPGSEHVIEYHVLTSGTCWAGLIGEPALRLEAGDIIVFPQGDAHVVASAPGMRGPTDLAFHAQSALQRLPVRVDYGGSGRDPVRVVCGFLACDARPFNPLLAALPRVIHLKKPSSANGEMLDHFMSYALTESCTPRAGGEVVLARLSELMFVEVVREYVSSLESTQRGWLSGLRDEAVGRALAALHARPNHAWTIEDLAHEVGASRSALAQRFMEYVGVPPMQYLAQWRMQLAATLLAGPKTLAQVAEAIGYGSEAAFSRAFKKIVGVAPATWRTMRAEATGRAGTAR